MSDGWIEWTGSLEELANHLGKEEDDFPPYGVEMERKNNSRMLFGSYCCCPESQCLSIDDIVRYRWVLGYGPKVGMSDAS